MKKIELMELVKDYLAGGDAPMDVKGKYHDQILYGFMNISFNSIVYQTWMEAKAHADYSVLDAWARNITLSISTGRVTLPYPPVQLPDNRGILQVAPSNDLTNPFVYLETNSQAVFNELEVGTVMDDPTFYMEQNPSPTADLHTDIYQLVLGNIPSGVTEVLVKMIVPLEQMDRFDEVTFPAEKEGVLIRSIIELLRTKPPEDVRNDNLTNNIQAQ